MGFRSYSLTFPAAGTRSSAVLIGSGSWGNAQLILPTSAVTPTLGMQTHTTWSENHPDVGLVNNPASDTGWAVVETILGVPVTCGTLDATNTTAVMLGTNAQQASTEAFATALPIGWVRLSASASPDAAAAYTVTLVISD